MTTLYLHIGMHKTGSTSLQQSLVESKSQLQQHNWDFIHLDPLGNSSLFVDVKKESSITTSISPILEAKLKGVNHENTIISGEHFSAINNKAALEDLNAQLDKYFDEVKIVIYLRRQDKIALSFKQQASKGLKKDHMLSSMLCGHSTHPLPTLTDDLTQYLDFHAKLTLWSMVFGKENLIVADFDNLENKDICDDFSKRVKLPITLTSQRSNEGVTRRFSLFSHRFIEKGLDPEVALHLRGKLNNDSEKVLPSRVEAIQFYQHFDVSNQKLASDFGLSFADKFDHYPLKSNYSYNDEDIDCLIDVVVNSLKKPLTDNDINCIRDIALQLEETHLAQSLSLMEIAHKLRPNGPKIAQKVKEYQEKLQH